MPSEALSLENPTADIRSKIDVTMRGQAHDNTMTVPETPISSAVDDPRRRRPSDRGYAIIHWLAMAFIAAVTMHALFGDRFVPIPRALRFRLFLATILAFNVLWWAVADRRWARSIVRTRTSRLLRTVTACFAVALNVPVFYMVITGRSLTFMASPVWYAAAVTLWHIGLVSLMPIVAGIRLLMLGAHRVWRAAIRPLMDGAARPDGSGSPSSAGATGGADQSGSVLAPDRRPMTRRALLHTAFASVPMASLAGGAALGRWQMGRFEVNRHQVAAPWLPDRLRGLTITHVSDLHLGRLYRPYMLPRLIDAVNRLDGDIVVVTGDIVDNSNDLLPAGADALLQFEHRYGLFVCIGNHDMIDDRGAFVRYLRPRVALLINERRRLEIGGERLTVAGVDYSSRPESTPWRPGDRDNVAETFLGHGDERDGPVVALAHHPHTWDVLAERGVPLTLAGHTHGGQVMLTPPRSDPALGAGSLMFRYMSGFYRRGGSTLFVNNGVGNWFPVRINAPAEIAQIQLV